MPIDPSVAVGAELPAQEFEWSSTDVQLYNLGIGAGSHPTDAGELRYLRDRGPQVLPTFATVAATFHQVEPPKVSFPGIEIDLAKVVHGSQEVTVHAPIPASGKGRTVTRVAEVWDKGKAAVVVQESVTEDLDGNPLWTARSSIFARGEGGFGGERGPSESVEYPDREPDAEFDVPTLPQQALLYRLCGDRNPLHSDPEFASAAGFPGTNSARAVHLRHRMQGGDRRSARRRRIAREGIPRPVRRCGLPRRDPPGARVERRRPQTRDRLRHRTRSRPCPGRRGTHRGVIATPSRKSDIRT